MQECVLMLSVCGAHAGVCSDVVCVCVCVRSSCRSVF